MQYKHKAIHCETNQDCTIYCNQYESCAYSSIHCPVDQHCSISCGHASSSCRNVIINATASASLTLDDCSSGDYWTCSGMMIHFPPQQPEGTPRAFINVGDNLNSLSQSLHFFAVNGFSDIDASQSMTGDFIHFDGTMYCTADYTESCPFADNSLSCQSPSDLCNDPLSLRSG